MSNVIVIDDDFEGMEQFGRDHRSAGHGNPDHKMTAWGMLASGKTLGKAMNVQYTGSTSATGAQSGTIDMLDVRGEDEYALPLCLTLSPPQIYEDLVGAVTDIQSLSGSQDNIQRERVVPSGIGGRVTVATQTRSFTNPLAIVEWGVGGVSNRVEADFFNGLCLNLTASWVRVRTALDTINWALVAPESAFYRLAAFIGPGQAKPNNAQRTMVLNESCAINTESSMYTVPRFAKSVHLAGANEAHDTFVGNIRFYRGADLASQNPVADYVFAGNTPGPIPVPAGAYYFTFVPGIADIMSMCAVFQLSV